MSERENSSARPLPVPSGRLTRMTRLGTMAAGIAGQAAIRGAGEFARGRRPEIRDLLVTPGNLRRMTEELARMRGAAMKVGQLISMDAGEVLPPELAEIMARLRDDAHFMPPKQLKTVLTANWGEGWLRHFHSFNVRPIAAASIGQVHRATLKDGRDVAIKVQYPGVAESIDSDVANVGALVRMSGLLPKGFDLAPYMEEARSQLHEETDYLAEGAHLARFGRMLDAEPQFVLPDYIEDWSTPSILTMSFVAGQPIETVADAPEAERNRVATEMIALLLRELFEFGEMQSDPNFANYRYDPESRRIVLLDFGATRRIDAELIELYRNLVGAGLANDAGRVECIARQIGFVSEADKPKHRERILGMIELVFEALRNRPEYDFSDLTLSRRMQAEGIALAEEGYVPPPLPMDVLYLQRKFGGIFLLAARLKATVPIKAMLEAELDRHRGRRIAV